MSRLDLKLDPKAGGGRRVEVITGGGAADAGPRVRRREPSRRRWNPGRGVGVARQHGATPQQLFTWRREARRKAAEGLSLVDGFVPVVWKPKLPQAAVRRSRRARLRQRARIRSSSMSRDQAFSSGPARSLAW